MASVNHLSSLFDELKPFKQQPIRNWYPEKTVDIDISVDRAGKWFYRGSAIERCSIFRLFATLLRLEDQHYYLVTPVVKYRITVEEFPFIAVDMNVAGHGAGQKLFFRTNMDEVVLAGRQHPLTVTTPPGSGNLIPWVLVRDGLGAKLTRSVFYRLAELAVVIPGDSNPESVQYGVWSDGPPW